MTVRRRLRRHLRPLLLLGGAAGIAALVLLAVPTRLMRSQELSTVDARFAIRGPQPAPADLVTVRIDEATFDQLGVQWPFPRRMHAVVIDRLRRAGATVIAYDVQFTERTGKRQDAALMAAVYRARGRIVLATAEVNQYGESGIFGGEEILRQLGARSGNALLPLDVDGVNRRVPSAVDGLPSLAVAVAEKRLGHRVPTGDFDDGPAWIDFRGPPGTVPGLSFADVYRGRFDPARVRGRIVVVGPTALTMQDVHATSSTSRQLMPGIEIHANGIATVLDGVPLTRVPEWIADALIVLFSFAIPLLALRLHARRWTGALAPALAIPLAGVYLIVAQLAFGTGVIVPVVAPLVALALGAVCVLAVEVAVAGVEGQRLRELFGRFHPRQMVDRINAGGPGQDLRGEAVHLDSTIVFCDLRGFTGFCEGRSADDILRVLNHYLEGMTEAIEARGGDVLQYQGDGILAAFGTPSDPSRHADRALDAVRDMAGPRLETFNAWLADEGLGGPLRMGIGVNSGAVVYGCVGSAQRMEYTAIGDTVNTASRLEETTKDLDCKVVVSKATQKQLLDGSTDLRFIEARTLRGRQAQTSVLVLDGLAEAGDEAT